MSQMKVTTDPRKKPQNPLNQKTQLDEVDHSTEAEVEAEVAGNCPTGGNRKSPPLRKSATMTRRVLLRAMRKQRQATRARRTNRPWKKRWLQKVTQPLGEEAEVVSVGEDVAEAEVLEPLQKSTGSRDKRRLQ